MKKRLIVIGIAPCLRDDLDAIENHELYDFMAVGIDAIDMIDKPLSYVATYHKDDIPIIRDRTNGSKIISHKNRSGADIIVETLFGQNHHKTSGSSALLGVCYALSIGYEKIILAGCPMEGFNKTKHSYSQFHKGWKIHSKEVMGKVKSMSGWTREFLGEPTKEWLSE